MLCDEPLSHDVDEPICDDCYEKWVEWYGLACENCGKICDECECMTSDLKYINPLGLIKSCVFYDSKRAKKFTNMFYKLKDEYDLSIIDLFAGKICDAILKSCAEKGVDYKKFVITFVPRRRISRIWRTYDHAEGLAKAVGKRLGLKVVKALVNTSRKQQKSLNRKERAINARKSYHLRKDYKSNEKFYILIDDVMTTGATILACANCLKKAGAIVVFPVTFARTPES
ncbi:MAG: ComF family protein [Clostridia bacterium]|nr:ComF family protein [Clostridia bacterium]